MRYAAERPEQIAGLVLIDGAYPIAMFDEAGKEKVRAQFRRLGWIMRIVAPLGRSARMSPAEPADVVLGMDAVNGQLGPDFAGRECPTVYIVGTGAHSGATKEEMRTMREAGAQAEASNKRVSVFATTPSNRAGWLTSSGAVAGALLPKISLVPPLLAAAALALLVVLECAGRTPGGVTRSPRRGAAQRSPCGWFATRAARRQNAGARREPIARAPDACISSGAGLCGRTVETLR